MRDHRSLLVQKYKEKLNSSHEDVINLNYTKQLLIFSYCTKVFLPSF